MNIGSERQYSVLMVLGLSLFCAMLGIGVISPILPIYAQKMGANGLALGAIVGAFSFSRIWGMAVSGELAEHMDRKRLLVSGLFIYALASIAYTMIGSTGELILVRMGHGLGSAMVVPIAMAIGSDIAPIGSEGAVLGSLQGALFVGMGFGPLLSGVLAEKVHFMAPFFAMTLLTVLSMGLILRFLPASRPLRAVVAVSGMKEALAGILRDREMVIVFLFQFCSAMCRGVLVMVIPLIATDLRFSLSWVGFIVSLNALATGVLQGFSGRLADRVSRHALVVAGGCVSAGTLLLLPHIDTLWGLVVASIAFGTGHALASPSLAAISSCRSLTYGSGRIMGLFNMAFSLGMAVGPVVIGILLDVLQNALPYYLLSGVLFLSVLPFLRRT